MRYPVEESAAKRERVLAVSDIEAARQQLVTQGVDASEVSCRNKR